MKRISIIAALFAVPLFIFAQKQFDSAQQQFSFARHQQQFKKQLPAGNYSGICAIGHNQYALVDDKAATDGFRIVRIEMDSIRQRITSVEDLGYQSSELPNRDMEGICFRASTQTVFISGEADNEVYEYTLNGQRTGRKLEMPAYIKQTQHNAGLESLTYDERKGLFFTATERPLAGDSLVRVLAFGNDLKLKHTYLYKPDEPISRKYFYGISEICALSDGRLLVMERQIRVPRLKIGASTVTRLYEVTPNTDERLTKKLVTEFRTRLSVTSRKFANFEGLCQVAPHCLLLLADSQNQYKGVLRDWFMCLPF